MTPRERWLQRTLRSLGARPVGHAVRPDDGEETIAPAAPVIPLQPTPAPGWPPTGARRISTTTAPGSLPPPGQTLDLAVDSHVDEGQEHETDAEPAEPAEPVGLARAAGEGETGPAEDQAHDQAAPCEAAPPAGPAPAGPVTKTPTAAPPTRTVRTWASTHMPTTDDPNMRIAVFNLTAAGVGYGTGLVTWLGQSLPYAEHTARGIFAFLLAAAGAVAGWKLFTSPAVAAILPGSIRGIPLPPVFWQTTAAAGAAELARHQAPLLVDWLNSYGTHYGLNANAISLLLTALGMCGGLWWLVDRRARTKHWLARWVLRIPLASALLATALYAPGAVS